MRLGYSEDDIYNILGGSVIRMLAEEAAVANQRESMQKYSEGS